MWSASSSACDSIMTQKTKLVLPMVCFMCILLGMSIGCKKIENTVLNICGIYILGSLHVWNSSATEIDMPVIHRSHANRSVQGSLELWVSRIMESSAVLVEIFKAAHWAIRAVLICDHDCCYTFVRLVITDGSGGGWVQHWSTFQLSLSYYCQQWSIMCCKSFGRAGCVHCGWFLLFSIHVTASIGISAKTGILGLSPSMILTLRMTWFMIISFFLP